MVSHLRVGKQGIKEQYLIQNADHTACHPQNHVKKYKLLDVAIPMSTFVLNCAWDIATLEKHLPGSFRSVIAQELLKFYTVDANKIGQEVGLGRRINMIMQTVFFKLANVNRSRRQSSSSMRRSRQRTARMTKILVVPKYTGSHEPGLFKNTKIRFELL